MSRLTTSLVFRETAATLEAESGYSLEAPSVSSFKRYIINGDWESADDVLTQLGVENEEVLLVRRILTCVSEQ